MKELNRMCGCGLGKATHPFGDSEKLRVHELGEGTCCRKLAIGTLIPTNFRIENDVNVCDVNGYTITYYTLTQQRLYNLHADGNWSLPKDEGSTNSLPDNF